MKDAVWYVHINGETFGPVTTPALLALLKQNRLQFADFIWSPGFTRWTRVADVHEFTVLLPQYPTAPFPTHDEHKTPIEIPPTKKSATAINTTTATSPEPVVAPPPKVEPPKKPKIRKGERVAITATVSVTGAGEFDVVNISENGVFIEGVQGKIEVGSDIKFKLKSKVFEKELDMTGVVVRAGATGETKGYAIEMTRVNPAHKRMILDYIESQFK
jgi:hypothetical protein